MADNVLLSPAGFAAPITPSLCRIYNAFMIFQVFTAEKVWIMVLWVVKPYRLADSSGRKYHGHYSTLKMKLIRSSEIFVTAQKTTRRPISCTVINFHLFT